MSFYVSIICESVDQHGNRCWNEDSPLGSPRTATEARRRLRREGWRRTRDGRDLCPEHAAPAA